MTIFHARAESRMRARGGRRHAQLKFMTTEALRVARAMLRRRGIWSLPGAFLTTVCFARATTYELVCYGAVLRLS
eukprot:4853286-Pyramimonas_sp.AAC.1